MDCAILEDSSNPRNIIQLTKKEFTVGRSLKCSHVLQDLNVSRQHCGFQFINNRWFVNDQSSNGTSLNGRVLQKDIKTVLNDGDIISLNDRCKYIFKMGNKESNTSDPKIEISEAEISEIAEISETVSECAAEFNQNFEAASQEDALIESASTSQNEKKKRRKGKRKFKSEENAEESDDIGEPKEKMIKSEVKLTEEDDELQCSICTELFVKAVTLTCSHTFCKYCIDQWRRNRADCPICRAKIDSVSPTLIIDNLIEKLIDKCSDEVKERRVKMVEERAAAASAVDAEKRLIVIDSEISDEDEEMEEDDVYWDYSSVNGWSDEEDDEDDDLDTVGDAPGPYYGGYGRCYICNHHGHWANGCPSRPRRF